jgi:hypothetical protein
MILVPISSPAVQKSANYGTILEMLDEVEIACIDSELDGIISARMITVSGNLGFDIIEGAAKAIPDRITVRMIEGEMHYGRKLLKKVVDAFAQEGITLTPNKRVSAFLNLYEGLKNDNPVMDEDYRSIFPGLSFSAGMKLGMVERDSTFDNAWRFV